MENLLTKRNIIIAGVSVVIIIGVLFYFGSKSGTQGTSGGGFFGIFPSSAPPSGPPSSTLGVDGRQTPSVFPGGGGELPLTPESAKNLPVGTLVRLSQENVSSIALVGTTSVRYHKNVAEALGHLFERKADGTDEEKRTSNFTVPQILRVLWASDARRAVIFYNLGGQIKKLLTDYSTSTPRTNFLPDGVSDVAFSPDSKRVVFINDVGESQNIFIANSDFGNQRKIFDNDIPNFEISWPAQNLIALKTKSSYAARGFLYSLNINTGEFAKIAEGLGLDAVWNLDGSGALYSRVTSDGNFFDLRFVDAKTGETKDLGVKTIAEKCAFSRTLKNAAYCAAPHSPAPGVGGLPDDWWKGKISFQDDFVLINTATGQVSSFIQTPLDVISPKILADDSYLLFRDKSSGDLWSLKLKP
ncbi:MAG: hypothetical protein HYW15_00535 [Candidatus Giovannonibacteria bacterium]|nr:MAG: hypothetical protein HYW15_00535 [Candidatus Giovannonibacteria bacterium]